MRHLIQISTILLVFIAGVLVPDVYSQNPTFNFTLANGKQVSNKIYEADIYLQSTSTTPIELATISLGISFNNAITSRGTLTACWVQSSSQLTNLSELPTALNTATAGVIKIAGKIPPGAGNGSIISNISPGTKIGRLRLTNNTKFAPGKQMSLAWLKASPYPTTVNAYIGKINTDITLSGQFNCVQSSSPDYTESPSIESNVQQNNPMSGGSANNINVTEMAGTPKDFGIGQNYPNPFNPSTKIDYQLPTDAKVRLEVYNIAGQKVGELVNQDQTAGNYTVDFGATGRLASGIYIYRMTAIEKATSTNFTETKKMMLLK